MQKGGYDLLIENKEEQQQTLESELSQVRGCFES